MDDHRVAVIIGAGAAGLTAAIVLARARADVLVIHDGRPRNAPAAHMHGFPSRDGADPAGFLRVALEEAGRYGAEVTRSRVVGATRGAGDGRIAVTLETGAVVRARATLVATGVTDELPAIPGVRELWGAAVHHCPHCHGYEERDRELVVIGSAVPGATLHQAALLRRQSDRVTACVDGVDIAGDDLDRLRAFGVRIVEGAVTGLTRDTGGTVAVRFADGAVRTCDAVFVAPRPRPNDAVLRALGCEPDPGTGLIAVGTAGATSVPGVWAAGNVVDPRAQVVTAAGEASVAAIAMTSWLLERDIAVAVERARALSGAERAQAPAVER